MYRKLLEALQAMDEEPDGGSSPSVQELDLFITTTDLHGLRVPLRLADPDRARTAAPQRVSLQVRDRGEPRNRLRPCFQPFPGVRCPLHFGLPVRV